MKPPVRYIGAIVVSASIAGAAFGVSESLSAVTQPESQHPAAALVVRQPVQTASEHSDRLAPRRHRVSASLLRHFRVLRSARDAAQEVALPPNIAESLTQPGMKSEFGLEPSQARYVTVTAGLHAWLVPGSGGICLIVPESVSERGETGNVPASGPVGAGEVCATEAKAVKGELMMVLSDPETGSGTVVGLAADGASVSSVDASGGSTAAPVRSNVYATDSKGMGAIYIRNAGGGVTTIPAPQP